MGIEVVSIVCGGVRYTGFEEVEWTAAFNHGARTFRFVVAAELGSSATNAIFKVDAEVQIFANADLVVSGYVDRKLPHFDAESARITVTGRSRSNDLIDSSADHKTGNFVNKDPQQIGAELAQGYGATFTTDQQLEKIDQYQLTPGATIFREIEKLARQQGMTLFGTADGNVKITKAGPGRQAGALIEGVNILEGDADHSGANRHSTYKVRGQRPFGHDDANLRIEATATDSGVPRKRTAIIIEDDDTTRDRAKKRAKQRRDRAAGNALKASISIQGFRDDAGQIVEPGNLWWTESPFLDIEQDMLIESVTCRQNARGSIATLALTDPRSYGGAGGKGNKSGSEWAQGDDDARDTTGE